MSRLIEQQEGVQMLAIQELPNSYLWYKNKACKNITVEISIPTKLVLQSLSIICSTQKDYTYLTQANNIQKIAPSQIKKLNSDTQTLARLSKPTMQRIYRIICCSLLRSTAKAWVAQLPPLHSTNVQINRVKNQIIPCDPYCLNNSKPHHLPKLKSF